MKARKFDDALHIISIMFLDSFLIRFNFDYASPSSRPLRIVFFLARRAPRCASGVHLLGVLISKT